MQFEWLTTETAKAANKLAIINEWIYPINDRLQSIAIEYKFNIDSVKFIFERAK